MDKKIIFHCGSAKTGSTSIQAQLMADPEYLAVHGAYYCPRMVRAGNIDPLNIAIRDVRNPKKRAKAVAAGRARLDELFQEKGFDTVILSNESAFGDPFNDQVVGFFPLLAPAIEGLKAMFEGHWVIPVFFIRSQAALIPSFYGQRVRQGAGYHLSEFSEKISAYDLSWRPIIEGVSSSFHGAPVEVHQFEHFTGDAHAYTAKLFSRLLGFDLAAEGKEITKNRTAKSHALGIMRFINRLVENLPLIRPHKEHVIKKRIRRRLFPFVESLKTGKKLSLPEAETEQLEQIYSADIQALSIKKRAGSGEPARRHLP